ncbi:hypothetical protein KIW84_056949 [Lathyrus oleraceus]|uniref:Uncharacterized protein n=1 Tax=Pisum sativum TaxID=3888 RepID=A0A9D4X2A7_PEA|nr:hypothetical protein KIW84_056949 [Pisum sativum]
MANSSMHEFSIIKAFNVDLYPSKAPMIIEVLWLYPTIGWLKCNTYDSFPPDWASCGGLFIDHSGDFVFCFAEKIAWGLGLRSIVIFNDAFKMMLCWDVLNLSESLALLLKSRVLRGGIPIKYHITSSIWSNTKIEVEGVSNNTRIILNGITIHMDSMTNSKIWIHSSSDNAFIVWTLRHNRLPIDDNLMLRGIGALNAELSFMPLLYSSSIIFGWSVIKSDSTVASIAINSPFHLSWVEPPKVVIPNVVRNKLDLPSYIFVIH